jgi:hypothetical protein
MQDIVKKLKNIVEGENNVRFILSNSYITVGDLIKLLKKEDPNLVVGISHPTGQFVEIEALVVDDEKKELEIS